MDQKPCPNCHLPVLANFYFCPNCGTNLRPKPLSLAAGKQIGIYLLSIFLPPLGLWPGVKYLLQKSAKAKIVGTVAIILTIVSVVVTVSLTLLLIDMIKKQLTVQLNEQLNSQLDKQLDSQMSNQMQNISPQMLKELYRL